MQVWMIEEMWHDQDNRDSWSLDPDLGIFASREAAQVKVEQHNEPLVSAAIEEHNSSARRTNVARAHRNELRAIGLGKGPSEPMRELIETLRWTPEGSWRVSDAYEVIDPSEDVEEPEGGMRVRVKTDAPIHPTGGPPSQYAGMEGVTADRTMAEWDVAVEFDGTIKGKGKDHLPHFMWDELEVLP